MSTVSKSQGKIDFLEKSQEKSGKVRKSQEKSGKVREWPCLVSKKSVNGILMIQICFIAGFRDFDKGGNWQNEFLKIFACSAIDLFMYSRCHNIIYPCQSNIPVFHTLELFCGLSFRFPSK